MLMAILRFGTAVIGTLLILVGIALTPSPVPFGLIIIALGLSLVVWSAPGAVRWVRRRWRWFDRRMTSLEQTLPEWLARPLRRSGKETDDSQTRKQDADTDEDTTSDAAMAREARRRRARH